MDVVADQHLRDIQRQYLDFLDDDADQGFYHAKVRDMIERGDRRLVVNINDLRAKNEEREGGRNQKNEMDSRQTSTKGDETKSRRRATSHLLSRDGLTGR